MLGVRDSEPRASESNPVVTGNDDARYVHRETERNVDHHPPPTAPRHGEWNHCKQCEMHALRPQRLGYESSTPALLYRG